eukprot:11179350-Lingulodinium_polyedra.AAC.1
MEEDGRAPLQLRGGGRGEPEKGREIEHERTDKEHLLHDRRMKENENEKKDTEKDNGQKEDEHI